MTLDFGRHQPLSRQLVPALVVVLVCQFLLGFGLHLHTSADCEAASALHSDYQELDQHLDRVDVTPDKLTNAFDGGGELPAMLFAAVLLVGWSLPTRGIVPFPETGPPLPARYASRPLTRAPPIA